MRLVPNILRASLIEFFYNNAFTTIYIRTMLSKESVEESIKIFEE